MTLQAGTRLGPYEIESPLGAGGMGEVWRAKDTRLARDVAVKVLPEEFFEDKDRVARFEREAKSLAALNHPGIAAIYSFEEVSGRHLLVMELVEGEGLDAKIAAGSLPLEESLSLARQIAEALETAHEKGIVHRDLKPGNVKVTPDDRVKLLDFGLAKVFEADPTGASPSATRSPTITARATAAGVILGTAAYMSPEQARGKSVDKRSDVWAFGCVLYEMLTGKRAFEGETVSDTLVSVLSKEPDWGALGAPVSSKVRELLRRCLQRDVKQRLRDIGDARIAIEEELGASAVASAPGSLPFEEIKAVPSSTVGRSAPAVFTRGSRKSRYLAWAIAAAFAAATGVLALHARAPALQPLLVRPLTDSGRDWFPAASPDGKLVAFVSDRDGRDRIWLKQMPDGDEQPLTSGPDDRPHFSPDGSSLLFVRREGAGSSLYRVGVLGGEPRRLVADATDGAFSCDGRRLAWVRESKEGERQVWTLTVGSADGGDAREVYRSTTTPFDWPAWSPDGTWIVCFPHTLGAAASAGPILVASDGSARRDPGTGHTQELSSSVWFGAGREILIARASPILNLFEAAACTIERMNPGTGEQFPVLESPNRVSAIDVLGPGRLVFDVNSNRVNLREVPVAGAGSPGVWLTRGLGMNRQPRYSPDGEWIVFSALRGGNVDVWSLQPRTGAVRRLTDSPAVDYDPALTPDGKHLLFSSDRSGHFEIWMADADGSGARQVTYDGVDAENATATPDGRWIVYSSADPKKFGIWKIRPDGSDATMLFQGLVEWPEVSPDGQYALFTFARGTEDSAIKVVRIPDRALVPFSIRLGATTRRVELIAGRARWMPDGKAIAFAAVDAKGHSGVFVQDFLPGRDTAASRRPLAGFDPEWAAETFAISPDGKRICLAEWEQVSSIMTAEGVPAVQGRTGSRK